MASQRAQPFSPEAVSLQAEKDKYLLRMQEKEQKELERENTIKVLTNEVEELNMKLSYLSNELARREDECSRQTSMIQKLTNQRDYLQEKVDHYERNIAVSNNLDSALRNLGDSAVVEENRHLKNQLATANQEIEHANQEIARLQAEFEMKTAGYRMLDADADQRERERARSKPPGAGEYGFDRSEGDKARNPESEVDGGRFAQADDPPQPQLPPPPPPEDAAPPPQPKAQVPSESPIHFELPFLSRFPVSRRGAHVLSVLREDGQYMPRYSPSLPYRHADIVVSNSASGSAPTSALTDAGGGGGGASGPAAVAEARAQLDAAVAALREHHAGTPQRPTSAGKDSIVVVVHSGRHLPKVES